MNTNNTLENSALNATKNNNLSVISTISDSVYSKNNMWSKLFQTIIKGDVKDTIKALKQGEDPNQKQIGESALFQAVDLEKIDHAVALLKFGADPNSTNNEGYSPLHTAVCKRNLSLVTNLLKFGANPNLQNRYLKRTPLHLCIYNRSTPEILYALIHFGASQQIKDARNLTAFEYLTDDMLELRKAVDLIKKDLIKSKTSIQNNLTNDKQSTLRSEQSLFYLSSRSNYMNNNPVSDRDVNILNSNNNESTIQLNTQQTVQSTNKNEISNINFLNMINNKEVSVRDIMNVNDTYNNYFSHEQNDDNTFIISPSKENKYISYQNNSIISYNNQPFLNNTNLNSFNNTNFENTLTINTESNPQSGEKTIIDNPLFSDRQETVIPNNVILHYTSIGNNTFTTEIDHTPVKSQWISKMSSNQFSYSKTDLKKSENSREIEDLSVFYLNPNHSNNNDHIRICSNIYIQSENSLSKIRQRSKSDLPENVLADHIISHKYNKSEASVNEPKSGNVIRRKLMYHNKDKKSVSDFTQKVEDVIVETSKDKESINNSKAKSRNSKEKTQLTILHLNSVNSSKISKDNGDVKDNGLTPIPNLKNNKVRGLNNKENINNLNVVNKKLSEDSLNHINHDHADDKKLKKDRKNHKQISSTNVNSTRHHSIVAKQDEQTKERKRLRMVSTLDNIKRDSNENIIVDTITDEVTYISDVNHSYITDNLEYIFDNTLIPSQRSKDSIKKIHFNTVGDLSKPNSPKCINDEIYVEDINKISKNINYDNINSSIAFDKRDHYFLSEKPEFKYNKLLRYNPEQSIENTELLDSYENDITASNNIKTLINNKHQKMKTKDYISDNHKLTCQLADWLAELELQQYINLFLKHNLTLDKMILKLKEGKFGIRELKIIGIEKPGHYLRIITRLKIDSGEVDNNVIKYILTLNNPKFGDMTKSNNLMYNSMFKSKFSSDRAACCGLVNFLESDKKMIENKNTTYQNIDNWLKKARLNCLNKNFLHNGFDFLEYVILMLYTDIIIDESFIENNLHVYNSNQSKALMRFFYTERETLRTKADLAYNFIHDKLSNGEASKGLGKSDYNILQESGSIQEGCNACTIF